MFHRLEERFVSQFGGICITDLRQRLVTRPHDITVIAFGGDQLTGKSTLTKNLVKHFGGHFMSSGTVFRELAKRRGVSLVQLLKDAVHEPGIDIQCDFNICKLVASPHEALSAMSATPLSSPLLILEGRNPACMASYVRELYHSLHSSSSSSSSSSAPSLRLIRIYLQCSPLEQMLRFIEREVAPPELGQACRTRAMELLSSRQIPAWALSLDNAYHATEKSAAQSRLISTTVVSAQPSSSSSRPSMPASISQSTVEASLETHRDGSQTALLSHSSSNQVSPLPHHPTHQVAVDHSLLISSSPEAIARRYRDLLDQILSHSSRVFFSPLASASASASSSSSHTSSQPQSTTSISRLDHAAVHQWIEPFIANVQRDALDRQRFHSLYALDYRLARHYDICIDTTPNSSAQTLQQALDALRPYENQGWLQSSAMTSKL